MIQKAFVIIGKVRNKGLIRSLRLAMSYGIRVLKEKVKLFYLVNYVARDANKDAIEKIKSLGGKRGLFLDCGSNVGQGFNLFRKIFKPIYFDYQLFEPNPNCIPVLQRIKNELLDHNVIVNQSAISISDGVALFYGLSETEGGGCLKEQVSSRNIIPPYTRRMKKLQFR